MAPATTGFATSRTPRRVRSRRCWPRVSTASLPRRRQPRCWHRSACPSARRTPPASASQPTRARRQGRRQRQPARVRPQGRRSRARYRAWSATAPCPPASVPCAIKTSAPASRACRAISSLCTWQISNAPAALIFGANGAGSPNDSMIGARIGVERDVEKFGFLRQTPGDEADAERSGAIFQLRGLRFEPGAIPIAAAKDAEAAGFTHRPGQPAAGDRVHRRQQDRMPDAQKCRQIRTDRHAFAPSSGQQP